MLLSRLSVKIPQQMVKIELSGWGPRPKPESELPSLDWATQCRVYFVTHCNHTTLIKISGFSDAYLSVYLLLSYSHVLKPAIAIDFKSNLPTTNIDFFFRLLGSTQMIPFRAFSQHFQKDNIVTLVWKTLSDHTLSRLQIETPSWLNL